MKVFVANSVSGLPILPMISQKTWGVQGEIQKPTFKSIKNLSRCDVILVPHDAYYIHNNPYYLNYLKSLSQFKPLLLSDCGDFPKDLKINNLITLRVAINPGESFKNKIIIPYNVKSFSQSKELKYGLEPIISFLGYKPRFLSPRRVMKSFSQRPFNPMLNNAAYVRYKSIKLVAKNFENCRITTRYYPNSTVKKPSQREDERLEYLDSISNSNIVLCPRGDANQSQRFYEALSAGRIPLVPDTKMIFPKILEVNLSVKKNFIFFNLQEKNLKSKVLTFWDQIDNSADYVDIQNMLKTFYSQNLNYSEFLNKMFLVDFQFFKFYYDISL
jgi:hypothetical protein